MDNQYQSIQSMQYIYNPCIIITQSMQTMQSIIHLFSVLSLYIQFNVRSMDNQSLVYTIHAEYYPWIISTQSIQCMQCITHE